MTEPSLLVRQDEAGIATVTLNRPDLRNAFDEHLIAGLTQAFHRLGADDQVRAVVLRGAGKAFSGGGDINWMKRMAANDWAENHRDAEKLALMLSSLDQLPKPTIAMVQGPAYGGGVGLVSACDIAIAGPQASFCLSEVKIGLIPAVISPYVLRALGERASRRYFLTAEVISAPDALRLGLVHELAADLEGMEKVLAAILEALRQGAPTAMGDSKALIRAISNRPIAQEVIAETARRIADRRAGAEGKEGTAAFLEKRKPSWLE